MLYELQFEACCRTCGSPTAFEVAFLYDDRLLANDKLLKNDDSRLVAMPRFWFNTGFNSHNFPCARMETIALKAGIYLIEVGARSYGCDPQVDIFSGRLTVKLSDYGWDPDPESSVKIASISD
ncbi:unnamed protein product [Rotaria magnacalcarata]|uniref:Uncharacterized protein n=1 Tax=Rotaria magnacalcarata TaxID=392030 RepID=A0A816N7S6_9BILA|nr:unnamed protein product [Rotaria magnacalcarata]CAF4032989.1 unnamed protein product [Rotaria magnacalcarata]